MGKQDCSRTLEETVVQVPSLEAKAVEPSTAPSFHQLLDKPLSEFCRGVRQEILGDADWDFDLAMPSNCQNADLIVYSATHRTHGADESSNINRKPHWGGDCAVLFVPIEGAALARAQGWEPVVVAEGWPDLEKELKNSRATKIMSSCFLPERPSIWVNPERAVSTSDVSRIVALFHEKKCDWVAVEDTISLSTFEEKYYRSAKALSEDRMAFLANHYEHAKMAMQLDTRMTSNDIILRSGRKEVYRAGELEWWIEFFQYSEIDELSLPAAWQAMMLPIDFIEQAATMGDGSIFPTQEGHGLICWTTKVQDVGARA